MRIGIDLQFLRWPPRGIYNYLWNLLEWMGQLDHPHQIVLCAYGHALLDEGQQVCRWKDAFSPANLHYYWDGPSLKLLSRHFGGDLSRSPWLIRQIDRRILLPLWRKLLAFEGTYPNKSRFIDWLWRPVPPSRRVDVFHHTAGLLFPLHERVNVMTIHDLIPYHYPELDPATTDTFEGGFKHVGQMDLVLVYSEHTKQDIIDSLGVPEDKIRVIPLAAHEQYHPLRDQEKIQSVLVRYGLVDRPYVLYLGGLEPRKNLHRLLDAYQYLREEEPALAHRLVLVGGGDIEKDLLQKADQLGLAAHVRCLGYVPFEDLPALLNGSDLFVFLSLCEGFGLPPLEAMSCGTPVVSSRMTSLPEVVGDAGLLVDPYQIEDIAAAMRRVLTDRGLHASLRAKGLARARTFSWENTARLTLAAYEEAWQLARNNERKRPDRTLVTKYRSQMNEWVHGTSLEYVSR